MDVVDGLDLGRVVDDVSPRPLSLGGVYLASKYDSMALLIIIMLLPTIQYHTHEGLHTYIDY